MSRLTIVVPAWNLGAPLVECLESLRQADESAKVIVVNNASDTPLPGTDRVTELTLPRRVSVGAARNAGLAKVTTPYVMFMDGDDILLPGALRYLVETLERRTDAVAVSGRAVAWDPHFGAEEPKDWPFDWMYRLAERPRAFAWVNCVPERFSDGRCGRDSNKGRSHPRWFLRCKLGRGLVPRRSAVLSRTRNHEPTHLRALPHRHG